MPYGYQGKILRVNLSDSAITIEEPGDNFYRSYLGGRSVIAYYLLKETQPGIDPLGPENVLIMAGGPVTGVPIGGAGRNSVGAKSPLTDGFRDAEVGGWFGAAFKHAGFDAVVFTGKADKPVYLVVHDGEVELRDAGQIWGKATADAAKALRDELGVGRVRTAMIGPGGERMVRFASVMNDINRAAGRAGVGAVMGSKNLKAVVAYGGKAPEVAEPEKVQELAKWMVQNYMEGAKALHELGTANVLGYLNAMGGLPTRNFRQGVFEGANDISGETMKSTIFLSPDTCYGCPVACKRVVKVDEPYKVDPLYGGPEYETLGALGSLCGVNDLKAIARGNELCNATGLDTISTGSAIAFAMECCEAGLLSAKDTGGLDLRFGNADAMLKAIERIAKREGIGDLLAEGPARAAQQIGGGAAKLAMHVKGQPMPMHEPRFKQGMGVGYAVAAQGADHNQSIHDTGYRRPGPGLADVNAMGVFEPMALDDIGPGKMRLFTYQQHFEAARNCLVMCMFVPWKHQQTADILQAVTGWNTNLWELLKAGERSTTMARAFNAREGWGREHDYLPKRMFEPLTGGRMMNNIAVNPDALQNAIDCYYGMMGWSIPDGIPTAGKLHELDLAWVTEELAKHGKSAGSGSFDSRL